MTFTQSKDSAESQNANLTELEKLELMRRLDVARGVLPRAITLFKVRNDCQAWVKSTEAKEKIDVWLLVSIVILMIAHIMMDKGENFTTPGSLSIIPLIWLVIQRYERYAANRAEAVVQDKLMELSVFFYGASGSWSAFWSIDTFHDVGTSGTTGYDYEDDRIRRWFFRVRLSIISSMIELEEMDRMRAICLNLCRTYGFSDDEYWNL